MGHQTLPTPSTLTRKAGLIGQPISHSISPYLHSTVYAAMGHPTWGQVLLETPDLPGTLKQLKADPTFMGSGVTMPYKVAVIPLLDALTPEATAIGAVNTVFLRPDPANPAKVKYWGTNTDCIGIRDSFLNNMPDPSACRGKPGLVIGGGGTSRAAIYALHTFLGCSPIYMVNRDPAEIAAVQAECARNLPSLPPDALIPLTTPAQASSLPIPPAAIVSAIPNFTPVTESEKNVREILTIIFSQPTKGAVLEMCYHPSPITQISQLAERNGWQVILGTEALLGQGLEQASLWSGCEITEEIRRRARFTVARELERMRNAA